jgi:cytochrome P450
MLDLTNKEFIQNPYPALKELRKEGQPIWHEPSGMFLASSYHHANAVLRTRTLGRIFTPKEPQEAWDAFNWLHADSILDSEPPKHTRLRSLVMKAFNPKKIDSLQPDVERITKELIIQAKAKQAETGSFDLIGDFAEPLPVKVIAAMLGFPDKDEHLLRPWSQAIVRMYEVAPSDEDRAQAQLAAEEFAQYVEDLMHERKRNPGTDLITELALVEEDGEKLNTHELIATCVLLLNAGHEASVNGFGNGFVAALNAPAEMKKLEADPWGIAGTAVDEFLRFDAPLHLFDRTATQDTEIGGVMIKEGQKIASLLGSANRDESIFENADQLDLSRRPNPHIGFGAGIHFCIGAPLARMEMTTSLPMLIEAFPNLRLVQEPVRRMTFVLRGYESVLISN